MELLRRYKPSVFISYRREESAGHVGRLYDRLAQRFGGDRVFMDVSAIEPGVAFVEAIKRSLASADTLVVVIGPSWLSVSARDGTRRLDDPADVVRQEIETALGHQLRIVPVLVDGARMPSAQSLPDTLKPLAGRNALDFSHARFDADFERLALTLSAPPSRPHRQRGPVVVWPAIPCAALGGILGYWSGLWHKQDVQFVPALLALLVWLSLLALYAFLRYSQALKGYQISHAVLFVGLLAGMAIGLPGGLGWDNVLPLSVYWAVLAAIGGFITYTRET